MAAAITVSPAGDSVRWVTGATLAALAARGLGKGAVFTSRDLRQWIPQLKSNSLGHAVETLIASGFVEHSRRVVAGSQAETLGHYTVTPQGDEAIKAAMGGASFKSGPKGPHSKDRLVPAQSFAFRLWALMRARRMLDSDSAAATLVDAGEDVAKAAKNAQRYFKRWASTGAIQESKHRLQGGRKRYVLVADCGPTPPAWTPKARARRSASSSAA